MKLAEGVDKTGLEMLTEGGPLFVCKAGVVAIAPRIGKVDLLVGDIQVAAENHRFCIRKFHTMLAESHIPDAGAEIQSGQVALGVRCVDVDKVEAIELECLYSPLGITHWLANATGTGKRLGTRHRQGTGIALAFR